MHAREGAPCIAPTCTFVQAFFDSSRDGWVAWGDGCTIVQVRACRPPLPPGPSLSGRKIVGGRDCRRRGAVGQDDLVVRLEREVPDPGVGLPAVHVNGPAVQ